MRVEENCLPLTAFTPAILRDSNISLLAAEGNLFEMKPLYDQEGYEKVKVMFLFIEMFKTAKRK